VRSSKKNRESVWLKRVLLLICQWRGQEKMKRMEPLLPLKPWRQRPTVTIISPPLLLAGSLRLAQCGLVFLFSNTPSFFLASFSLACNQEYHESRKGSRPFLSCILWNTRWYAHVVLRSCLSFWGLCFYAVIRFFGC